MLKDFINGNKFRELCDFDFRAPHFTKKKEYILYGDLEFYIDALSFASQHADKRFVLVTHNGDTTVNYTGIPFNVVHWYTQNLNFKHPKVSPVPIGLENPHWHPSKMGLLHSANTDGPRMNKMFAQFNPMTRRDVRGRLLDLIAEQEIDADCYPCLNGTDFDLYLKNLLTYKYCLCPRGNGIDTHRLWEALYMKCIPVVQRFPAHAPFEGILPIYFIDRWADFKPGVEPPGSFDSELLTMTYWNNKIKSHFND